MTSIFEGRTYSARGCDVHVDPLETPTFGGRSITLGFPLMSVSRSHLEAAVASEVAHATAALLNRDAKGGTDLAAFIARQMDFSQQAFGPGLRTRGIIEHIRKELSEVEANPLDVMEWVDIILLAMDGAWRHGHTPETITRALNSKLSENEKRNWPDWRTCSEDAAIEHVKDAPGCPHCGARHPPDGMCV